MLYPMPLARLLALLLFTLDFCFSQTQPQEIPNLRPSILLISIDGFRWDYAQRIPTPNLHRLMKKGVSADALIPSFPTKTFPNHYSIVTGLYPEHSGIAANDMWDDSIGKKFSMGDREQVQNAAWWRGEPIWVTAEKAGQKTSALFWPGSEAPIEGVRPTYWLPYEPNQKMTHNQRLATFFSWLEKPAAERPTFFTLYFSDVDTAGHDFGPLSPEVRNSVQKVDATIGNLLAGLEQRGVLDKVNIIVVSDHGMVAVDPKKNIFVDYYIDLSQVRIAAWTPVLTLSAGDNTDAIIAKLGKAPHMKVYRKEDVPARLHYNDSDRIPPIVAIADPGWTITSHKRFTEKKKPTRGEHGYDNAVKDTWGIFIAHGPAFRSGMRIRPFENIHIYSAMCSILGLQPAPNDGSLAVLAPALRATVPRPQQTTPQTTSPRTEPVADHRF